MKKLSPKECAKHAAVVGVGTVIYHRGRYLVMERQGAHGAGTWGLPGGHVEHGEDLATTARRESWEEVGLRVLVDPVPIGVSDGAQDGLLRDTGLHYLTVFMYGELEGDPDLEEMAPREPDKCSALAWLPWPEVGGLHLFAPLSRFWERLHLAGRTPREQHQYVLGVRPIQTRLNRDDPE